jgi:electron transfer flavoprotein alpha subunit
VAGGILVLVEQLKGKVADVSFEALGVGRKIADALKVPVWAVAVGGPASSAPSDWGAADGLLVLEDPKLEVPAPETVVSLLLDLMEKKQASLVLVGGTNWAYGIGSQLAVRAKLPCANFCKGVRIEGGAVVWTSQLFGGKIQVDVRLPGNKGVAVVYPGSFPPEAGRRGGTPPVEKVDAPAAPPRVAFKRYLEPAGGDVDITQKDILVAVGRGLQTKDNLELAEELATALGGAVCASRPVVDQGWMPMTRQVGKSGMQVKPKLYLALGISGAPEHLEGMQHSKTIVAVNTDPKAPIFGVAHYGAVADILEVMPALIEKLKT